MTPRETDRLLSPSEPPVRCWVLAGVLGAGPTSNEIRRLRKVLDRLGFHVVQKRR